MKIGIIGFSRFGQLLAQILQPYAEVVVWNRSDKSELAAQLGISWTSLEEVCQSDWVFVSVAMSGTEEMIKQVAPLVKKDALIMDVCSVKVLPAKWLKEYLPETTEIMATHPMFGPDSAANGTRGLQWILCPLRVSESTLKEVKKLLHQLEVQIIQMEPEEHDKETAISLAMVHFIGRSLEEFGIKDQHIATVGYKRLLKVNETVTNDTWQLFVDMHRFNPYAAEVRERLIKSFNNVNNKLKQEEP